MTFLCGLLQRELTARPASLQPNRVHSRSYQLSRILPRIATDDVFLGFSVCGQFLISYKMDFKRFLLRFWCFPPQSLPDEHESKLQLFAEVPFSHSIYVSRFQDTPCVRFIQSKLDFSSFVLLYCDYDGDGVVAAYGSMPDVDCEQCMNVYFRLNGTSPINTTFSQRCPLHLQVLLLNMDLPIMSDRTPCVLDSSTTEQDKCVQSNRGTSEHDVLSKRDHIPPCLQIYGPPVHGTGWTGSEAEKGLNGCSCFASTPWPIGGIQVSVSTATGTLRLAWASPDAQIKVISCAFDKIQRTVSPTTRCRIYPQGTFRRSHEHIAPYAFKTPLLTQNYCSHCYSWPAHVTHSCRLPDSSALPHSHLDPFVCIFRQQSTPISIVDDADHWPDNHKTFGTSPRRSKHECFQSDLRGNLRDPAQSSSVSAFLFQRPWFTCCRSLTYLAMMEDIRASYVHWTLVSRAPCSSLSNTVSINVNLDPAYHQTGDLTDEELGFSSGSHSSDDDEDSLALITSPESNDQTQSPEDLLAHHLSGQCHTSFDLTCWQELGEDPWASSTQSTASVDRTLVHLEEVVFDIPMDQTTEHRLSASNGDLPILFLFSPTEEPELLLIYQICHSCGHVPTHATSIRLYGAIDLTTGERLSVRRDGEQFGQVLQSMSSPVLTLSSDRLKELTAQCPCNSGLVRNGTRSKLVHELNNVHMTSRLESLRLLVDPQGGYQVYW